MERKPTVAVVFHHIGPYHHARLNAATDKLSVIGVEWSAKGDVAWGAADLAARYQKKSLFPEATDDYPQKSDLRRTFSAALDQTNPAVVAVNGWNNFGSMIAARYCVQRARPMVLMSESARQDEPRSLWKEMIKRRIVDLYAAALVGGERHVDYLVELGMSRERIFTGYDVVDNDYFSQRAIEIRNSKFETRKQYGLPENYFLASARFIEKKNLLRLIRAYAGYRRESAIRNQKSGIADKNAQWDLVLLGDGPLRETLNSQVSALNLRDSVHLPGFKQYDELPVYYALANAFVHASTTEQWGLVVNEAIASGLPVIVSDRCGCVPELVRGNGFVFDPSNERELASRLLQMASLSQQEQTSLADASSGIAANFVPERFGDGLEQAVNVAMTQRKTKPRVINRAVLRAAAKYGR